MRMLVATVLVALAVAACGGDAADDTTSTTAAEPATTAAAPDTTEAAAPTTTAGDTTTTTEATTTTSGSEATGDLSVVQSALSQSADAAPSRVEGTISVIGMEDMEGAAFELPFSATVDAESGNSAVVMDFTGMGEIAGEEIPAEFGDLFGEFEIRTVDGTDYIKFGFFTTFLGSETEWVSQPSTTEDDLADDFGTTAPNDPTAYLESLSDAEGSVEVLGREDVRGFDTTHYRVTVDAGYLESLSDEERAELEAQGPLPVEEFPLELWVDDDGLVHRMRIEVLGDAVAETDEDLEGFESMTMVFDYFDFGQSVTIEPPPADQVTPIDELSGGFGLGSVPTTP